MEWFYTSRNNSPMYLLFIISESPKTSVRYTVYTVLNLINPSGYHRVGHVFGSKNMSSYYRSNDPLSSISVDTNIFPMSKPSSVYTHK